MDAPQKINAEYLQFPFRFDLIIIVFTSQLRKAGISLLNMILSVPTDSFIFMLK